MSSENAGQTICRVRAAEDDRGKTVVVRIDSAQTNAADWHVPCCEKSVLTNARCQTWGKQSCTDSKGPDHFEETKPCVSYDILKNTSINRAG